MSQIYEPYLPNVLNNAASKKKNHIPLNRIKKLRVFIITDRNQLKYDYKLKTITQNNLHKV